MEAVMEIMMSKANSLVRIKENNRTQVLFITGWSLMVIHLYVNYSSLSEYSNSIVSFISFCLFVLKIVKTRYTAKEIVFCGFLMFIGMMNMWITKDIRVCWYAIVIMAVKNVNIEKTIKATYYTTIMCCIVFFLSYLLKISEDEIVYLSNGNVRHGFGLGHPNTLHAYTLYMISMTIYVYYEQLKRKTLIILAAASLLVYSFTYSRTGIIVTTIILIAAWLIRFSPYKNLVNHGVAVSAGLYIVVFSMLPIVYYKFMNPVFSKLNDLLTYRISQAAYFCSAYGIKLFGIRPIELTYEKKYIYLDMGYVSMMVCQGLVYYLVVVGSMVYLLNKYAKERCYKRMLILFSFILFLGTENVAAYVFLNVSMLFISEIVYSNKRRGLLKEP